MSPNGPSSPASSIAEDTSAPRPGWQRDNAAGPIHRIIAGEIAVLSTIYLGMALFGRSGAVLSGAVPFAIATHSFIALASFSVSFLAFGRYHVLRDSISFWVGMGFAGYGVATIFYILSFPGLLPDGTSLLARWTNTPAWIMTLLLSFLGLLLLVATMIRWPGNLALAGYRWLWPLAASIAFISAAYGWLIAREAYLPVLVEESGDFKPLLLELDSFLLLVFLLGALLSIRRYSRSGDVLPGYVALTQVTFAFNLVGNLLGRRRYAPLWFLSRVTILCGMIAMLFGLLYEFVRLYRHEQQSEEALRKAYGDWERTFDSVPDLIAILDNDYRITRVNRAMARRLGVTPEMAAGLTCFRCVHGTEQPPDSCPHRLTLLDGQEHSAEVHEERLGGDFLVTTTPMFDHQGILAGTVHVARDITGRKHAEEALRESEERLRLFIEYSPVALAMFDREMHYLHVSRRWLADYGLGNRDLRGLSHYEVLPEVPERWRQIHRRALGGEVVRSDSDRFDRGDGAVQWLRWEVRPWHDAAGDIGGIVIFTEDITERRMAEEVVRESREWLRVTLRSIGDAVLTCNAAGRITFLNPAAEALTGWSMEEALNQPIQQVFRIVDEQTQEPAEDVVARVLRESRTVASSQPALFLTREARPVPIEECAAPIRDAAGNVNGVVLVFHDVSEKRRAEEVVRRYELLAGHSRDIILFMRQQDGHILEANAAASAAYGYSREDLLDLTIYDLREPGTNALTAEQMAAVAHGIQFETRHVRKDGSTFPVEVSAQGAIVAGEFTLISVIRDITERKRTEEALIRSEKLASVGRLAATIAHEINNPLAGVMNIVYLARNQADVPAAVQQQLDIADNELKRVAQITRQALGFYRESAAPASVCVADVLDSALELLHGRFEAKRAIAARRYDPCPAVLAVSGELRQIFANLLTNSLDAIAEGGVIQLHISNLTTASGRQVRITLADSGKGIDAGSRPHIFEPFFTTKGAAGTGLGLWICRQLIEKQKGTIRVRSRAGKGTAFVILLPAETGIAPDLSRAAAST
jgi:PAS domain S-box-containing protein